MDSFSFQMSHGHPTSTVASRSTPLRRKWFIDLQIRKNDRLIMANPENYSTMTTNQSSLVPLGFSEQRLNDTITQEDDARLLSKRSWDIASQPIKQLPMNVILAWMAGNSFSLMSIMIVLMLFMKPIQVMQ